MTRDFDNVLLSLNYVRYFKEKKNLENNSFRIILIICKNNLRVVINLKMSFRPFDW